MKSSDNRGTNTALIINERQIYFTLVDGIYYVAIKPICEALEVEYTRQFKNIKEDKILSQLLAKRPMTGADGKTYSMTCLPEKYVYGWIFGLNSNSEILHSYKKKCYDVLYDYFHGIMSQRQNVLTEIQSKQERMKELEEKLGKNEDYKALQQLQTEKRKFMKQLKVMDTQMISIQPTLFDVP